jgi:DUF917 family protein
MLVPHPQFLRREDVAHLIVGAELLGSGGGGDPHILRGTVERHLADHPLPLLGPDALKDAHVAPVGMVGGTSVMGEKLPAGTEFSTAFHAVGAWSSRSADAVMGFEAGGVNALTGLVAALELGLPYLDADLMGRALPRLDQLTWAAAGIAVTPASLCQSNGQVVVIDGGSPEDLERAVRTLVAMVGGWAAIALVPTPVPDAVTGASLGGVARALALGRAHAELPAKPSRSQVGEALGGRVLGAGRVWDVSRKSQAAGFGRGSVTVVDELDGTVLRLETENEYLLALADGDVVATCPDLLCVLQARSAVPLPVDRVRSGDDVLVVTLPGPSWWLDEHRLPWVSPKAFGLDTSPVLADGA